MPRYARMLIPDEKAVYHIMTRTALDGFPFGDLEKDEFVRIIRVFSKVYFTEILGYAIMGNHFLCRALHKKWFEISGADRFRYRTKYFTDSGIIGTRAFVARHYQALKQLFSCKHAKKPNIINGLDGIYSLKRLPEKA